MTSHQRQKNTSNQHKSQENNISKINYKKYNRRSLKDIFKTIQKTTAHKQYAHHKNGPCTNNSTLEDITPNNGTDSKQVNKEVNNEQVISDEVVPVNRDGEDKSKESDDCIKT